MMTSFVTSQGLNDMAGTQLAQASAKITQFLGVENSNQSQINSTQFFSVKVAKYQDNPKRLN